MFGFSGGGAKLNGLVSEIHRTHPQLEVDKVGAEAVLVKLSTTRCSRWRTTALGGAPLVTGTERGEVREVRGATDLLGAKGVDTLLTGGSESSRTAAAALFTARWRKAKIQLGHGFYSDEVGQGRKEVLARNLLWPSSERGGGVAAVTVELGSATMAKEERSSRLVGK